MLYVLTVLLLAVIGLLLWWRIKDAPAALELAALRAREVENQENARLLQEQTRTNQELVIQNTRLTSELENERRSAAEKQRLLEDSEVRLKKDFENLANRIFEDRGKALTELNRDKIGELLQPFREQLDFFRKRVDEVHHKDVELSSRLFEQVRQLQALSNKVSDDANNLAKAIKGDSKRQGDWGELIVSRIFEASGLERGREFDEQRAFRDDDGNLKKPDFVVYLPENKALIVDAKVSLTAFDRFCAAEDEIARTAALAEHVKSVRRHVEELSAKDYSSLMGNRSLDFVIMCIPLEPAYQAAMQGDPNLLYDLARTRVVISGPATLVITLKLIAQIWRREHENSNAEKIAERAGRMYDQVALIIDAMEDAQKRLSGVTGSFELALKRLKDGRGNLVGRIEELRRLGAKVSKQLPGETVENAVSEGAVLSAEELVAED